jgi:hypothetical protein
MMFPVLLIPPMSIADPGTVRLGDGMISAELPSRRHFGRRGLLRTSYLIPAVIAAAMLDGCSALTTAVALAPEIAQYAGTIASAISFILPSIKTLTGLAGGAYNTIAWVAGQIDAAATRVKTAAVGDAQALVSIVSGGAATIVGDLAGLPSLPGIASSVLTNVTALWPELEKLVGLTPTPVPPVAAMHFAGALAPLTAARAYANLRAILAAPR